jgi:hypothetical protein
MGQGVLASRGAPWRGLDANWAIQGIGQWRRMAPGGPELELRVALGHQAQHDGVLPGQDVNALDDLRVTAIEAFGQADDRAEQPHRAAPRFRQLAEIAMALARCREPMVPRDEADDLDFVGVEAAQITVGDQILRMFVMVLVRDVDADVVQQRRVFEPFALAALEAVDRRGAVEERERQP